MKNVPWIITQPLSQTKYAKICQEAAFEHCKWDLKIGDVSALCPYPIILKKDEWETLKQLSIQLNNEILTAEAEIAHKPQLFKKLDIPFLMRRQLRRFISANSQMAIAGPRVIRFDFHWTTDGWMISEANTDVPGGFIEASGFTQLMQKEYQDFDSSGNPAQAYSESLLQQAGRNAHIGFVHATAYTDDRQVMIYLSNHCQKMGLNSHLTSPSNIIWKNHKAFVATKNGDQALDTLVRFFPAEWLPNLGAKSSWPYFFYRSQTPLSNPATALLTQSKLFPVVWNYLNTKLPTWEKLLPQTKHVSRFQKLDFKSKVYKMAFGRVGEEILFEGITSNKKQKHFIRSIRLHPGAWVEQKRFEALPMETTEGNRYPCFGVFVIDGKVAGIYGRIAQKPLINSSSQEAAVLVEH